MSILRINESVAYDPTNNTIYFDDFSMDWSELQTAINSASERYACVKPEEIAVTAKDKIEDATDISLEIMNLANTLLGVLRQ